MMYGTVSTQALSPLVSPLETVNNDCFIAIGQQLTLRQFFRISSVSRTLRRNTLSIIASSDTLLSRVCSKLIALQDEEAVAATLKALDEHKGKNELSLCLKLDVNAFWYGTEAAIETIERQFKNIPRVTLIHKEYRGEVRFNPKLPYSLQELTVRTQGFTPTSASLKNPQGLKVLHIYPFHKLYTLAKTDLPEALSTSLEYANITFLKLKSGNAFGIPGENGIDNFLVSLKTGQIELLEKSAKLSPQFIPAIFALAAAQAGSEAIEIYARAAEQKPDNALTHFFGGQVYENFSPTSALVCYKRAAELAFADGEVDLLFDIADTVFSDDGPLQSEFRELARYSIRQAWKLLLKRPSYGIPTEYVEKTIAIDPKHIWARFKFADEIKEDQIDARPHIDAILPTFLRKNNPLDLLRLLNITEDVEVHEQVWSALFKDVQLGNMFRLLKEWGYPNDTCLYECVKRGVSIELACLAMIYDGGSESVYKSIVRGELAGGQLQDLSYCPKRFLLRWQDSIWPFLHRLEREVREQNRELRNSVCELFRRDHDHKKWWLLFLFLHNHHLFADIQIQILESLARQVFCALTKLTLWITSFQARASFSSHPTVHPKISSMRLNMMISLLKMARIALAKSYSLIAICRVQKCFFTR